VVNGSPVLLEVKPPAPMASLLGKWLGHELQFSRDADQHSWFALAGVGLEAKAGDYALTLSGRSEAGNAVTWEHPVHVYHARYKTVSLAVPKQFVAPDPQQLAAIQKDKEIKQQVFAQSAPEREWSGRFIPPLHAEVTDAFGTRREFNGQVQSVHQGLDFRAHQDTPVSAVNAGKVILARPLFFEGNCVVIDHGQGLMTLYMHLSKFLVKEGDPVKTGQEIGLSGATGRATGPHLHVAVRWQGEYLNPEALFELPVP
jgi:murein DD-endopeptidase MepM/ murein hydrolase activator NlpD